MPSSREADPHGDQLVLSRLLLGPEIERAVLDAADETRVHLLDALHHHVVEARFAFLSGRNLGQGERAHLGQLVLKIGGDRERDVEHARTDGVELLVSADDLGAADIVDLEPPLQFLVDCGDPDVGLDHDRMVLGHEAHGAHRDFLRTGRNRPGGRRNRGGSD
jgi:hypothetical protein